MTEAEWLACTDPKPMLKFLHGKASDRKLRLFACACCRHIWHLLADDRSRKAVELAERFADGLASEQEREAAEEAANQAKRVTGVSRQASNYTIPEMFTIAARAACVTAEGDADTETLLAIVAACSLIARNEASGLGWEAEMVACSSTLREIVGNTFLPPPPLPAAVLTWNDGTVRRMAEGIYEERAFDRLPILADALLDAGCDNENLIAHCRSEGPHVRGCWAVDLILGKS